jgi:hypothetical protein
MTHMPQSSTRPFDEYRDTPLWKALSRALTELETTGEVKVSTAPEYVIGYLCRELTAKKIVTMTAVGREQRD